MKLLKRIPISYKGELHEVKLINFSVERQEVESFVPWKIRIRDFGGRAMISIVNVLLKNMHPSFLPESLHFSYRHIGFRLLVDDAHWNDGLTRKGIFFIKSFTDKPWVVQGGHLMTDYNLQLAKIICTPQLLALKSGEKFLNYSFEEDHPGPANPGLKQTIGLLDRAYSVLDGQIRVTEIQREKWPLEEINCYHFQTNFFRTARLEGAFKVTQTIPYQWIPPRAIR